MNNEKITRYESLQILIKELDKELSELKKEFIASGGIETDLFTVVIKDNFRETVASKDIFAEKFGTNWLKENDLLKLSVFNTVVVARKIKKQKSSEVA